MIKKYNLALTPCTKGHDVIALAQQFAPIADQYLLSELPSKRSLPHVTLYPFEVDEKQIDSIWKQVCAAWNEQPIKLNFTNFSCLTFGGGIYWVSLLPDKNYSNDLHRMHDLLKKTVNLPKQRVFDPHMTLISTKNKDYEQEVDKLVHSYVHALIVDEFVLSLGESDGIGQLIKIIHRYEAKPSLAYKS